MFEFHADAAKYFEINVANTERYILPFIEKIKPIINGMRVLEIGCGEGGVLKPFLDKGCICVGIEFDEVRLVKGRNFLENEIRSDTLKFISKDIYKADVDADFGGTFDIIVLKDVIEHIHDQQKLLAVMQGMLSEGGVIFFGFPPWQMPWGGHQQILKNKWLSKIPYYHLLPMPLYKSILKIARENVAEMEEIKQTGISIERFEKIASNTNYEVVNKQHFLINPIYEYKFNLKPRQQINFVSKLPWVRNFLTSCVYYLISKKQR